MDIHDIKGAIKFTESPMGGQQLVVYRQLNNIVEDIKGCKHDQPEFLNAVQNFVSFVKGTVTFLCLDKRGPFERSVENLIFTSGFMDKIADQISQACTLFTGVCPKQEWYGAFAPEELNILIQNSIAPTLVKLSRNSIEIGMECLLQEILIRDILPFNGGIDGKNMVARGMHAAFSEWYLHM